MNELYSYKNVFRAYLLNTEMTFGFAIFANMPCGKMNIFLDNNL